MASQIGIIDYGAGNLSSVFRAIQLAGGDPKLVKTPTEVEKLDRIVLPGVGAFQYAIEHLHASGLVDALQKHIGKSKPLLGVCLGMQMLLDRSLEFGETKGLGFIKGEVIPIPSAPGRRIPHIGWSGIRASKNLSILSSMPLDKEFYFAHSFHCVVDASVEAAVFEYDSLTMTAALTQNSIMGCQFHPELSAEAGIEIYREFIKI